MDFDEQQPGKRGRRRFLADSTLGLVAAGLGAGAARAATATTTVGSPAAKPLRRIAFGSCADQDQPQPVWDAINALEPELFVFLGDNIYADTRDMSVMREKYARFEAIPGVRKLRERTPVMAIWDDHDFGENDAGGDYPMREESRRIFCDFWQEPADSPRRSRSGIYTSAVFGPPGQRVQLLLPDLRYNRSPMLQVDRGGVDYRAWAERLAREGQPVIGPYARNSAPDASMLGEEQWRWLEEQFRVPAELRIVASSVQVLADFTGWECWANFARDQQRLLDLIRSSRAGGVVLISGDMHYAELSMLEGTTPYPLWELTSSGLTEVYPWPAPNRNRVSDALTEVNFGLIEIDWDAGPGICLQARDVRGAVRIEKSLTLAQLSAL